MLSVLEMTVFKSLDYFLSLELNKWEGKRVEFGVDFFQTITLLQVYI